MIDGMKRRMLLVHVFDNHVLLAVRKLNIAHGTVTDTNTVRTKTLKSLLMKALQERDQRDFFFSFVFLHFWTATLICKPNRRKVVHRGWRTHTEATVTNRKHRRACFPVFRGMNEQSLYTNHNRLTLWLQTCEFQPGETNASSV